MFYGTELILWYYLSNGKGLCDLVLGMLENYNRICSLSAAAGLFARCTLDLMGVHEVRWEKGDIVRAGHYTIFYAKMKSGTSYFVHHRIASAVKRVQIVSDSVLYTALKGRWDNKRF